MKIRSKLVLISRTWLHGTHRVGQFRCYCGKIFTTRLESVNNGNTTSCGCYRPLRKHGESRTRTAEYSRWNGMKTRCNNPRATSYSRYGGRGIRVCDRWINSYENFLADMGRCPIGYSLNRIDNNKGYSPENCCWDTYKNQARNRRHGCPTCTCRP
jgi:hypothetical protein